MLQWIVSLLAGYLLGSIPLGFLVVRWTRGKDVRRVGSGRTGGTNVLRAAGLGAAVVVGLGDGLKAALAVLVARWVGGGLLVQALAGVAAVIGHDYPVFLSFRGGAGTMASIGGAVVLWPWSVVVLVPALLAVVLGSRRASLGSIAIAISLPALFAVRAALGAGAWECVVHGVLSSALTMWSLRPNIRRLLRGEERHVSIGVGKA